MTWYVDSGGSSHLTNNKRRLEGVWKRNVQIETANGHMPSEAVVSIKFNPASVNSHQLRDVLYCPDFTDNLLSVSKLTEKNLDVIFKSENGEWRSSMRKLPNVDIWGHHSTKKVIGCWKYLVERFFMLER